MAHLLKTFKGRPVFKVYPRGSNYVELVFLNAVAGSPRERIRVTSTEMVQHYRQVVTDKPVFQKDLRPAMH